MGSFGANFNTISILWKLVNFPAPGLKPWNCEEAWILNLCIVALWHSKIRIWRLALETQNCCPCLHQRGAFYTTGILTHPSVDLLVLRQSLTKSITFTIGPPDWLNNANSAYLELHATQRPKKSAVGEQRKSRQTVVEAQLSETQGCFLEWHPSQPSLN